MGAEEMAGQDSTDIAVSWPFQHINSFPLVGGYVSKSFLSFRTCSIHIVCDGPCYDHQKNYQTVSEMSVPGNPKGWLLGG